MVAPTVWLQYWGKWEGYYHNQSGSRRDKERAGAPVTERPRAIVVGGGGVS